MAEQDTERALDQATMAGATLGGVAGVAVGSGTGLGLGLCALSGGITCGVMLPAAGAFLGALAVKRWFEGRNARRRVAKPRSPATPGQTRSR